jgi:hypothetical protein
VGVVYIISIVNQVWLSGMPAGSHSLQRGREREREGGREGGREGMNAYAYEVNTVQNAWTP